MGQATVAQSFGLAPRGWRRLWPRRPHQQVAFLIVVYIAAGLTVAGTIQPRLTEVRTSADRAEQVRPVILNFAKWEKEQLQLGSALVETAGSNADERPAFIEEAGRTFTEIQGLWNVYLDAALGTTREIALQRAYDEEYVRFTDLGLAVLSSSGEIPLEQVAELATSADTLRDRIQDLRAYYEDELAAAVGATADEAKATEQLHRVAVVVALAVLVTIAVIVVRSLRRRDREIVARSYRNELETRLQRALEMVHNEHAAYPVVEKAIALSTSRRPSQLLVADSSRAHFHQVVVIDRGQPWSGCSVVAPTDCPAAVRGQTQVFDSSTDLDACPYLVDRPYGACSAACVPVSIAGNTVGVIHTTGPDQHPLDDDTVAALELVARKAGERVGMLRAFSVSQTQAHSDPLTGLMNRRSVEDSVRDLDKSAQRYVVAYADIDHFKLLNDVHGHDTGDRALRLFARVLRDSVRPQDIPARYGGEEFVVVLPDCDVSDAYAVAERIREGLAASLVGAKVPPFTVSIGLAGYEPSLTFSEMVEQADRALVDAKKTGRNRTVIAGEVDRDGHAVGAHAVESHALDV